MAVEPPGYRMTFKFSTSAADSEVATSRGRCPARRRRTMQRTIAAVALVGAIALTSVPATGQTRGLGVLAGTIASEDGGEPVAGVLVKVPMKDGSAVEAKTDDSGKWNMSGIGKGEFHMIVY